MSRTEGLQSRHDGQGREDSPRCRPEGRTTIPAPPGRFRLGTAAGLSKRRCAAASPSSCPKIRLVNCTGCGQRRCLLPVDGWFEWQQTGRGKQPYFLTLKDGSPLSFAALWERWDQGASPLETFTIITTVASPGLEDLHHRQPAIIDPRWFNNWLDPRTPLPALLELARQPHDGPFQRRAVSSRVNSVRNDDPDVLLPVAESKQF